MEEYKRLLVLKSALENLDEEEMPPDIMRENITPLTIWLDKRIDKLEEIMEGDY